MEKTAVIIVTYKRKEILENALISVLKQSVAVESIYLVDNNQDHATLNFIRKAFQLDEGVYVTENKEYRRRNYSLEFNKRSYNFIHLEMKTNSGGAGGFHYGMKSAFDDGCQWFFLMDDDISLEINTIEIMFNFTQMSMCVHANRLTNEGEMLTQPGFFDFTVGRTYFMNDWSLLKREYTISNLGCFEGMLIHRQIIKKIGFPDKDFFIVGDDTIYGFLASFFTNVVFVKTAIVKKLESAEHNDTLRRSYYSNSKIKTFYSIRNQWIIFAYLERIGSLNKKLAYSIFVHKIINTAFISIVKKKPSYLALIIRAIVSGIHIHRYKINEFATSPLFYEQP